MRRFPERNIMKKNEKREPEEAVSVGHKILTGIGVVLCIILIPILILNCTLILKSYTNKDQVPSVGGIFPMIILTDSMEPEFSSGDLIICVICPIILLVAYDVIRRRIYEASRKKDTDALMAELEALRAEKEKQNKENK